MRFKTEQELIATVGADWRDNHPGWPTSMDYLLGTQLAPSNAKGLREREVTTITKRRAGNKPWMITPWMVTEDEDLQKELRELYKQYGKDAVALAVLKDIRNGE